MGVGPVPPGVGFLASQLIVGGRRFELFMNVELGEVVVIVAGHGGRFDQLDARAYRRFIITRQPYATRLGKPGRPRAVRIHRPQAAAEAVRIERIEHGDGMSPIAGSEQAAQADAHASPLRPDGSASLAGFSLRRQGRLFGRGLVIGFAVRVEHQHRRRHLE